MCVLYKSVQNTLSFNQNDQNQTFFTLVAILVDYGKKSGASTLFVYSPWCEPGLFFPFYTPPKLHFSLDQASNPNFFLPYSECTILLSLGRGGTGGWDMLEVLLRSPPRFGNSRTLQAWSPLADGGGGCCGSWISDFLALGSLRALFTSSHPVSFTPWLFYCFITFATSVAKDFDEGYSPLSHFANPQVLLF